MYIGPEMFREITDRDTARRIFAQTVVRIEMETHSYCNRRCTYCPNVIGDRIGENKRLSTELWSKTIGNLAEIGYKNNLVLNYYNEPLADRVILDRIRDARELLPAAKLMIYTNGDYLSPDYIDELAAAGLDYMHLSIHLKRGDVYSDIYVVNRIIEASVRMGLTSRISKIRSQEFCIAQAPHKSLEIEIRGINFQSHGTDRGGLIADITTQEKRTSPCSFVFGHFVMSYQGDIVPCCHIRTERPEHEKFVYGNLHNYPSIFQAFTSAPAAAWRREMASNLEKRAPCDSCAAGKITDLQSLSAIQSAYERNVLAAVG